MSSFLNSFLKPSSIAVIGASPDSKKLNGELLEFLIEGGFRGRIAPVNPNYKEIRGHKCYTDIASVAGPVDLAVIVIPARGVPQVLAECAKNNVRNALIISSGFAEEGGDSVQLQRAVSDIARSTGIRVAGPNSEGFYNATDRVCATFSPTVPRSWKRPSPIAGARRIGIVAQSGGMGFAIFDRGLAARLDFSYVITSGNEVDLTMADFVDFLVDDAETGVICLFCESIRDGGRFREAMARAQRIGKPIVVLKVGRSVAGSRATASHTASIAGWNAAYSAYFAKYGVIAVDDVDEAIAACGLLATNPPWGPGRRLAVVTPSGGGGALAADAVERAGFVVPALSEPVQSALKAKMPSYGSAGNPIDVTAQGSRAGVLVDAVQGMQVSGEVDAIVCVQSLASETKISFDAAALGRRPEHHPKPLACYSYTLPSDFARARLAEAGLFVNANLSAMAAAMQKIVTAAEGEPHPEAEVRGQMNSERIQADLYDYSGRSLTEWRTKGLLRKWEVEASREELATTLDGALQAAGRLGYPVALKIQSEQILHKTEVGGVRLGISDPAMLEKAFMEVLASAKSSPAEGVLVQKMSPPGVEMIVGILEDAVFGPVVMVGAGGTAVELYRDVAYWPAPLSPREATALIGSLKSSARFQGFRGSQAIDIGPFAALVSRLSQVVAAARGRIRELECNPVIVHSDGSGVTIADALMRVAD